MRGMFAPLLALALSAAPFPLPGIDGKPLAVVEGQKTFRLPMRFEKVRAFYEERFKDAAGVTVRVSGTPGSRSLSLSSARASDAWKSAMVKEGEIETVVELKPGAKATPDELIALAREKLGGVKAPKTVDFIAALPRSPVGKVLKKDLRATYWAGHERKI